MLAGSWTSAYGAWRIPTVSKPATPPGADGTWNSSSWVGLDGTYGTFDVLQVGIQQREGADGTPFYVAWYEWYTPPFRNPPRYRNQVNIDNFPVGPGDEVVGVIEYRDGLGHVHLGNLSNGKYFTIVLQPPANASFIGNTAEWVMEAPDKGEPATSLPKFTPVVFSNGLATGAGGAAGTPAAGDTWNVPA